MNNGFKMGNNIMDYETAQDLGLIDFRVSNNENSNDFVISNREKFGSPDDRLTETRNRIDMFRKGII
jgi:hypothetical protein